MKLSAEFFYTHALKYIAAFVFLGISLFFIEKIDYVLVLVVGLALVTIFLRNIEYALFYIALITPLSIQLSDISKFEQLDLSLFTEPILFLLLIILFFKIILKKFEIDKGFLTKILFLQLFWFFFTSFTSVNVLVSLKASIARAWFFIPIYILGIDVFKNFRKLKLFFYLHVLTLIIVVIYSTLNLLETSFLDQNSAHAVMKPFYNDHTAYGAILALLLPLFFLLIFSDKIKSLYKIILIIVFLILLVGVILSYSRASWLSIIVAVGILILVILRIRLFYVLLFIFSVSIFLWAFWTEIVDSLSKNRQESSSNIAQHIESITNISTDASNVERLNRWYCAIEMFKERPFFGWGPNTYQFEYAPYQLKKMRTIISTNEGDWGNAHSEYLTPLVEQGIVGLVIMLIVVVTILVSGFNAYYRAKDKEVKLVSLGITLGFVTYFFHGLMNNFLDTDKLAIPFFAMAAALTAINKYHLGNSSNS